MVNRWWGGGERSDGKLLVPFHTRRISPLLFFLFSPPRPKRNKAPRHFYYRLRNPNWNPIPIDYFFFFERERVPPLHRPLKNPSPFFLSSRSTISFFFFFPSSLFFFLSIRIISLDNRDFSSIQYSASLKFNRVIFISNAIVVFCRASQLMPATIISVDAKRMHDFETFVT